MSIYSKNYFETKNNETLILKIGNLIEENLKLKQEIDELRIENESLISESKRKKNENKRLLNLEFKTKHFLTIFECNKIILENNAKIIKINNETILSNKQQILENKKEISKYENLCKIQYGINDEIEDEIFYNKCCQNWE